jgi:hypothetical protein
MPCGNISATIFVAKFPSNRGIEAGIMKKNRITILAVSIALAGLISGCSSKEEKAAKAKEEAAEQAARATEKLFKAANLPEPAYISSTDLSQIAGPRADETLLVIDAGPAPGAETNVQPPSDPGSNTAPAGAGEVSQPAAAPQPQLYEQVCAPLLTTGSGLVEYAARCAGRTVTGIGRVLYSYPQQGTVIAVGRETYLVKLKAPHTAPSYVFNDAVTIKGIADGPPSPGRTTTQLKDVTLAIVPPKGTPEQVRAMRALRLGTICLDAGNRDEGSPERHFKYPTFVTMVALHPKELNSGIVQIDSSVTNRPERCLIDNGKIKAAQISRSDYVADKANIAWDDRVVWEAQLNAAVDKDRLEAEAKTKKQIEEYRNSSPKEKLAAILPAIEASAEAISEAIPTDISAQGYLENCNVAMAGGLRSFKEQGNVENWEEAARVCSGHAAQLCKPERHTRGCNAFWDKRPRISIMLDAR